MSIISNTKKRILMQLKENECHGYILAQKLDIPLASIYGHLKELREAGLIEYVKEKDRKKIYQLTEKGTSLLKLID